MVKKTISRHCPFKLFFVEERGRSEMERGQQPGGGGGPDTGDTEQGGGTTHTQVPAEPVGPAGAAGVF